MDSHCWGSALHGFKADAFSAALVSEAIYIRIACFINVFTRCMKPHREIIQGLEADALLHCGRQLANGVLSHPGQCFDKGLGESATVALQSPGSRFL